VRCDIYPRELNVTSFSHRRIIGLQMETCFLSGIEQSLIRLDPASIGTIIRNALTMVPPRRGIKGGGQGGRKGGRVVAGRHARARRGTGAGRNEKERGWLLFRSFL